MGFVWEVGSGRKAAEMDVTELSGADADIDVNVVVIGSDRGTSAMFALRHITDKGCPCQKRLIRSRSDANAMPFLRCSL